MNIEIESLRRTKKITDLIATIDNYINYFGSPPKSFHVYGDVFDNLVTSIMRQKKLEKGDIVPAHKGIALVRFHG